MPTCPKGHSSAAADYCDECGTPIGGPAPAGINGTPAAVTPAATGGGPAATGGGEPCPDCGAPRAGRFCEVCGRDFQAVAAPPVVAPPVVVPPVVVPPVVVPPSSALPGGAPPAAVPAQVPAKRPDAATRDAGPEATAPGWRLVVVADLAYHGRMLAATAPDATPVPFPAFCPERRFALPASQVLIGRRSRSRGIEPDIDLTGPPEDAGVSHAHALLVRDQNGWTVVDLDSANGTYLNDSADPIEANTPVPVADGDRIHLGAWTTLTLTAIA